MLFEADAGEEKVADEGSDEKVAPEEGGADDQQEAEAEPVAPVAEAGDVEMKDAADKPADEAEPDGQVEKDESMEEVCLHSRMTYL